MSDFANDPFYHHTELWSRSEHSLGTTIPQDILMMKSAPTGDTAQVAWQLDLDAKYPIFVRFVEEGDEYPENEFEFRTDLFQRSENSYAATVPHPVLNHRKESENVVAWTVDNTHFYTVKARFTSDTETSTND